MARSLGWPNIGSPNKRTHGSTSEELEVIQRQDAGIRAGGADDAIKGGPGADRENLCVQAAAAAETSADAYDDEQLPACMASDASS